MSKFGKTTLITGLLLPGAALAQISVGDDLGVSETAIRAALQAQGYSAAEIEIEDGEIEIDAMRGGQSYEIEVSPETGLVLAFQAEDEDDDDEDEDEEEDEHDDDQDDDDDDDDDDESDDD